jgi:hypothetical protein
MLVCLRNNMYLYYEYNYIDNKKGCILDYISYAQTGFFGTLFVFNFITGAADEKR